MVGRERGPMTGEGGAMTDREGLRRSALRWGAFWIAWLVVVSAMGRPWAASVGRRRVGAVGVGCGSMTAPPVGARILEEWRILPRCRPGRKRHTWRRAPCREHDDCAACGSIRWRVLSLRGLSWRYRRGIGSAREAGQ